MKQTQLYERHEALGARIVDFAGWALPVQYPTGPVKEHVNVRERAGLFDIDHMAQLEVRGSDALPYLQRMVTWDVARMEMNEAHYSLVCYQDGGIVDDIFVYRLPDRYFIAINASNADKDTQWFQAHTSGFDVQVRNISEETYMLALQGPKAEAILQKLTTPDLSAMPYHSSVETEIAGVPTLVGRTGYTGEDGFELFFPAHKAVHVWDRIMEAGEPEGLLPIGLAARDSLRFEPCMPLYGQEIGADLDPIGAGLGWAVCFEKGHFIGREALLKIKLEGPEYKLVAFEMVDRGVPRHEYEVMVDDVSVGEVTTGMYSPTTGRYVGLAYVPSAYSALDTEIGILIRGKVKQARVVRKPFYTPAYRR